MATKRIVIDPDQKLTPEIWAKMEREILIDKVPIKRVAAQYGFRIQTVRRRLEEGGLQGFEPLKPLVERKVALEREILEVQDRMKDFPMTRQLTAKDLERKLLNISHHLSSAAEQGAATAHRAALLANERMEAVAQLGGLDDLDVKRLEEVAMLTQTANEAGQIGLKILGANKDRVNKTDEPERLTLANFYSSKSI